MLILNWLAHSKLVCHTRMGPKSKEIQSNCPQCEAGAELPGGGVVVTGALVVVAVGLVEVVVLCSDCHN